MSAVRIGDLAQEYDVVRALNRPDGHLILVGEHHSAPASRRLVKQVLNTAQPHLVAIESCPSQQALAADSEQNVSEGADAAVAYARETDSPVGLIDKAQSTLLADISTLPPESVPFDPPEPDASGDIPADATHSYRTRLRETCPRRYDVLVARREEYMAGILETLAQTTTGGITAVLGASHLHAVADQLSEGDVRPRDVPEKRIQSV